MGERGTPGQVPATQTVWQHATELAARAVSRNVVRMPVRSLADDLRGRSDDDLAHLFESRPDLLHPVPSHLAALVSRASTSASTGRVLDRLNTWALQILEVLSALPDPTSAGEVYRAVASVPHDEIDRAIEELRQRALVWTDGTQLHLVQAAREAVAAYPCGLAPIGLRATDISTVRRYLAEAPADVSTVLEHLMWGPPVGSVEAATRTVTQASARTPIEWLLSRNLLIPRDERTVILPREVALELRDGAFLRDPMPEPPSPLPGRSHSDAAVVQASGEAAFTAVRWIETLLEQWSVTPPAQLRSGGLGVRDLTSASRLLDVDESTAALVIELAHAAGLLASDEEEQPVWLPTPAYDLWLSVEVAERWSAIVRAWLVLPRAPALIGQNESGRVNALTAEVDRPDAPDIRRLVLELMADGATDESAVRAGVTWKRPRRASQVRDVMVDATVREAASLGVSALGRLGPGGMALLSRQPSTTSTRARLNADDVAAALAPTLPEPLDHMLLQADLTAVAPGPLESGLARELALMADVESTGGATVYRFSPDSVRRAFDAGRTAVDVIAFLEGRSRTPLPQPLRYLIDDVARRHGVVRVGMAGCYVRCDDDTALAAVLSDRRAAALRPVRLAPGVLVLQASLDEALPVLRTLGLAPAVEASDGSVVVRRPDSRRAPRGPRPVPRALDTGKPDALLLAAAVKALRAGDRVAATPRRTAEGPARLGHIPVTPPGDTMAALREAIARESSLWIGYADTDGRATERIIDPVEISRGFLTAYDHRYEEVRSFALARITGVAPAVEPDPA